MQTYRRNAIVLRKTPLGETDLIVTLLSQDGSQLRCVAKGARKPSSSFASRLELYSVAEVHCAKGRSLDIVKEARLVNGNAALRADLEHSAVAAPVAELLSLLSHEGLPSPKLFPMTEAAFGLMGECTPNQALALCAAELLKALAIAGFRPQLSSCISCGQPVTLDAGGQVRINDIDGGVLCDACSAFSETRLVDASLMGWCEALIKARFTDVLAWGLEPALSFEAIAFAHQWTRVHVGKSLKSLNFLFTCGLF